MHRLDHQFVDGIRASSRQMVRELGFLESRLAATPYSASAVHAILEVGARGSITAFELAECLHLEKSSVSRMLRKLIDAGELQEMATEGDGRVKKLSLTRLGKKTFNAIEAYGRNQVTSALANLDPQEAHTVSTGLQAYAQALSKRGTGVNNKSKPDIQITRGYRPAAIGRITEMHARYYSGLVGFGQHFESQVAAGLAEFTGRLGNSQNGLWLALLAEKVVGSVAIDSEDLGKGRAHLRWFIVDDGLRGHGIGGKLLKKAVAHCDQIGSDETHLWTFDGLHAARYLYEANGFKLAKQQRGKQWGKIVTEQLFVRLRKD